MKSDRNTIGTVGLLAWSILRYGMILLSLFAIIFGMNYSLIKNEKYQSASDTDILICGPSILKTSVDPVQLGHAENISQDEEMYPMSYIKLKEILPRNPQIKTLILAYSPPLIATKMDALAFSNPYFEQQIIRRLYPISKPSDYDSWAIDQRTVYQIFFQKYFLPNIDFIKQVFKGDKTDQEIPRLPYIGKYKSKDKSKLNESQERLLRRVTPLNDAEKQVSTFLTEGLYSIIELCKKEEVELILLGPPLHQSIHNIIPPRVRTEYKRLAETLPSDNLHVLDLTDMHLPDDHYFNASHINKKGSGVVTDTLITWMSEQKLFNE